MKQLPKNQPQRQKRKVENQAPLEEYFNDEENLTAIQTRLSSWFKKNSIIHPWRQAWLQTGSPYPVWLSEVMLQQTTIQSVTPAFVRFFTTLPSLDKLAKADDSLLRNLVAGLGYYRRFAWMKQGAIQIYQSRDKQGNIVWPRNSEEWLKIKGVGKYTAAAISSITLGEQIGVVDGNVERVVSRLKKLSFATGDRELKEKAQKWMNKIVQTPFPGAMNEAMMELGQLVCRPFNPQCSDCPLGSVCLARRENKVDFFPLKKPKKEKTKLDLALVFRIRGHQVETIKRGNSAFFLRNHQGFLTYRLDNSSWVPDGHNTALPPKLLALGTFKHSITKYDLNVNVFMSKALKQISMPTKNDLADLQRKLSNNLDLKALKLFLKHAQVENKK